MRFIVACVLSHGDIFSQPACAEYAGIPAMYFLLLLMKRRRVSAPYEIREKDHGISNLKFLWGSYEVSRDFVI